MYHVQWVAFTFYKNTEMNFNGIFTVNLYESLHYYLRSKWCVCAPSLLAKHTHNWIEFRWSKLNEPFKNFDNFVSFFSVFRSYVNGVLNQYLFTVKSITVKRTMTLLKFIFAHTFNTWSDKKYVYVGGGFVLTKIFTKVLNAKTIFFVCKKRWLNCFWIIM